MSLSARGAYRGRVRLVKQADIAYNYWPAMGKWVSVSSSSSGNPDLGDWMASTFIDASDTGVFPILSWQLTPVISKPSFTAYWRDVWRRRAFIWADARAKALQTTRGTLLGKVWLVLSPFLNAMIFYVVFGLLLHISRGIPNFLGYLAIGVLFFPVYSGALSSGSKALISSARLVKAFPFPKATVVVSWSVRAFIDFIPVYVAALLFIALVPPRVAPSWLWLLSIPIVLLGFVFGNGLALLLSSITAAVKDLKFIWPLVGRFWFYTSGVFFSISRFDSIFAVVVIMQANPAYVFLTMCRDVLIYGTVPSLFQWVYLSGWSLGMWIVGAVVFWWREESYAEELD